MRPVRLLVILAVGACDSSTGPAGLDHIAIELSPARASYAIPDSVRASVRGYARDGTWVPVGEITWRSITPELADINSGGLVTARARGTAIIEASTGGKTARLEIPLRGTLHRGYNLASDQTWRVADTPHVVTDYLTIGTIYGYLDTTVLTIEPGVTIRFRPGAGLDVGGIDPGALLIAAGGDPVIMEGDSAARASWIGLSFLHSRSELRNVRIRHCGRDKPFNNPMSCVRLASGELLLQDVTISDAHNGAELFGTILAGSRNLSVERTDGFVAIMRPENVGVFPHGGHFTANADSELVIAGGTVLTSATWIQAPLPWRVRGGVALGSDSAVLTLPPGLHLRFDELAALSIAQGSVHIGASAGPPVILEASGTDWAGLDIEHGGGSFLRNVELRDCGRSSSSANFGACLRFAGTGGVDTGLVVQHVTVRDSRNAGVFVDCCGFFHPSSTDLTITGSANEALRMRPFNVATIPPGSYTGNGLDAVYVWGSVIDQTQTWSRTDLSYLFPEGLTVSSSLGPMTLTLEPGVTIQAGVGTTISVSTATLRAIGTASAPITFKSATPGIAGSWFGLSIGGDALTTVQLEHVIIEDAGGGPVPYGGALRLAADPGGLLRRSIIRRSMGCGIILANGQTWTDDYTDPAFENTFVDVSGPLRCEAPS